MISAFGSAFFTLLNPCSDNCVWYRSRYFRFFCAVSHASDLSVTSVRSSLRSTKPACFDSCAIPASVMKGSLVHYYVAAYAGSDLQTLSALAVLVLVLMVKPSGLFSTTATRRV